MAVFTLESLVLRGVAVEFDGTALNTRLGTSVEAADVRTAGIGTFPCHPLSDPDAAGAGRSQGAGVPRYLVSASPTGAPAAGLFAGGQEKRFAVGSAWRMPAGRTLSTTIRGARSR